MKYAKQFKNIIAISTVILFLCCAEGFMAQHQTGSTKVEKQIHVGNSLLTIPNVMLVNDRNQKVRLYEDVIKDRIVLLSFFYTSCQYICLMQGQSLAKLQADLKGRVGKDVFLISITTDPETDTPQKLREWAAHQGRKNGWMLLTGEKSEIDKVVTTFTGDSVGRPQLHSSLVYIGNDANGQWRAINGLSNTENLIAAIENVTRTRRQ